MEFVLPHEELLRNLEICALILLVGLWEVFGTSRPATAPVYFRWLNHFALVFIDNLVSRLLLPALAVGVAIYVSEHDWGLLNLFTLPPIAGFVITLLLFELANYVQHRLMHWSPILWNFHKVHHSDIDVDWSTGFRFHPGETLFVGLLQAAVIVLFGLPATAVAAYEIAFVASAYFVHANVVMPPTLERILRQVLITPNMHRIHHSCEREEYNSNYGGIFSWWDRWFATYTAEPLSGHLDMVLGLPQYRHGKEQNLFWLLKLPFKGADELVPGRRQSRDEEVLS
jgi:sterol desaturase/sphingolipid hydroxylase (fatty acid hydroxylase superfamily)